jgi:hypothetical protein
VVLIANASNAKVAGSVSTSQDINLPVLTMIFFLPSTGLFGSYFCSFIVIVGSVFCFFRPEQISNEVVTNDSWSYAGRFCHWPRIVVVIMSSLSTSLNLKLEIGQPHLTNVHAMLFSQDALPPCDLG